MPNNPKDRPRRNKSDMNRNLGQEQERRHEEDVPRRSESDIERGGMERNQPRGE